VPFLEIKNMQGLLNKKTDNIGLGLAGSRAIVKYMGGDIRLLKSQPGLTVFEFRIPVKLSGSATNNSGG
jgi:signal transduction histidine kinase